MADLVPTYITVVTPIDIPELRGRYATTPPHGWVLTFRAPAMLQEQVDSVIKRISPKMSRGLYIRECVAAVTIALLQHFADQEQQAKESETNE